MMVTVVLLAAIVILGLGLQALDEAYHNAVKRAQEEFDEKQKLLVELAALRKTVASYEYVQNSKV
jgi:hypothetical protein